jgi:hypothetical protein
MVVKKVLRSLPLIFDAKVSSIEEMKDINSLTIDKLHGILMTYEMRNEKEKKLNQEVAFKYSNKMKNKEQNSSNCFSCESDTEEEHFVRNLKKGFGKYKGKLLFKFFNCGKVGHFVGKCLYAKNESSDDEEDHNIKKGRKHRQYKKNKHEKKNTYKKKKSLYSKAVSDPFEESNESIYDSDR